MTLDRPKSIAFYLPQYHVIPENEAWWGTGFTDWVNVRKAKPLYPGHYQPHVPGELGEYDLLDPTVRRRQAELASRSGIDAFCYYHYWFEGRRLLERPFEEVLASGDPDFPFCLCWANEDWTREWSGSGKVLMPQTYSPDDDVAHGKWLARAFADDRYLRINGKALMLVYRARALPDPARTANAWRTVAKDAGAGEILLCAVESSRREKGDPRQFGFDAAVEFQPDWEKARPPLARTILTKLAATARLPVEAGPRFTRIQYDDLMGSALSGPDVAFPRFRCAVPGWDNTPRRERNAVVVEGNSPERYGEWISDLARRDAPALFVNAWNEWAEGCHLEPCERWGRSFLDAHVRAIKPGG